MEGHPLTNHPAGGMAATRKKDEEGGRETGPGKCGVSLVRTVLARKTEGRERRTLQRRKREKRSRGGGSKKDF